MCSPVGGPHLLGAVCQLASQGFVYEMAACRGPWPFFLALFGPFFVLVCCCCRGCNFVVRASQPPGAAAEAAAAEQRVASRHSSRRGRFIVFV